MTKDDAVKFFGSHEKIAEIIGTTRQSVSKRDFFMPLAQIRLYVASKGRLAMDESLTLLVDQVVKIMFKENEK